MYRSLEYDHADLPNLKSQKGENLAKQLLEEWHYRREARQELVDEIWPACDDAFSCKRNLPRNKGMKWADRSDYGDTDARDGVLFLANAITLALMPPDDSWLDLYSYKNDDQWRKNKMRDYQQYLHRKADTRGSYEVHVIQACTRGVSAITWEWKCVKRRKRMSYSDAYILAMKHFEETGELVDPDTIRSKVRLPFEIYNGPAVQVLDMYDVYPDPCSRITSFDDMPVAIMTYRSVEELKNSKDENGQPLYGNLEGLTPSTMTEIYKSDPKRYESLKTLGVNPMGYDGSNKQYVPVLLFHRQVQGLDNSKDQWVDCLFEVALTEDQTGGRLIRAYENPSDMGSPICFFDTYSDYIANTPYQTGVVEKALPALQAKNLISALTIQAQLVQTFPAVGVLTDALVNPKKFDPSAGGINMIKNTRAGLQFVAPLNLGQASAMDGMQAQQWYGQKMLSSMGAYGAIMQAPDRTITRSKTATQINTESTTGSIGRDNLLQKFMLRSLEPLAQSILHASVQYNREGIAQFERMIGSSIVGETLTQEELDMDWRVVVTGQKSKINKAQEMQEMQQAFQYVTTANPQMLQMNPMLVPLSIQILMAILNRLNIKDLEKYNQDPMQALLNHPMIGQQLQQMQQEAYAAGSQEGQVLQFPQQEKQPFEVIPGGQLGQEVNIA